MKKRRELDALAGKSGRRKKGQHELLMNDSESSEIEEFALPQKMSLRKHGRGCQSCSKFAPVCGMLLLLTCMAAVVFLTWMHIQMKQDMEYLRQQVDTVRSSSRDLPRLMSDVQNSVAGHTKAITDMQTNISIIVAQVAVLNRTAQDLKTSFSTAPYLESLPESVAQLTRNVAALGSQVTSVSGEMADINAAVKDLETTVNTKPTSAAVTTTAAAPTPATSPSGLAVNPLDDVGSHPVSVLQTLNKMSEDITRLNDSVSGMKAVSGSIKTHEHQLLLMRNVTLMLDHRLLALENLLHGSDDIALLVQSTVQAEMSNISRVLDDKASLSDVEKLRSRVMEYTQATNTRLQNVEQSLLSYSAPHRPSEQDKSVDTPSPSTSSAAQLNPTVTGAEGDALPDSNDTEADSVTNDPTMSIYKEIGFRENSTSNHGSFSNFTELAMMFSQLDQDAKGFIGPSDLDGLDLDVSKVDSNHDGQITLGELSKFYHLTEVQETNMSVGNKEEDDGLDDLLTDLEDE